MREHSSDFLIIGAGFSGLYCARKAARSGYSVRILESGSQPGRKLMLAGGGKPNITNRFVDPANFIGLDQEFTRPVLRRHKPEYLVRELAQWGIILEEREQGQLFCRESGRHLRDILLSDCCKAGVDIRAGSPVLSIRFDGRFEAHTASGTFSAPRLALATGSPAWPACGADDSGLRLAAALGHQIVPPRPVLVPLVMPEDWPLAGLAGVSCRVRICCPETASPSFHTDLLFTHKGISGPAALQVSGYWRKGARILCDFLPDLRFDALIDTNEAGKRSPRSLLIRHLPERLVDALLPPSLASRRCAELSRQARRDLAESVHAFPMLPLRTEGMKRAEAAAGGVRTSEVDPATLRSARVPGLFFCGEVLDVAGQLGGYNLHWAWASASAVAEMLKEEK